MADAGDAVVQRLLSEAERLWPAAPPHAITIAKAFPRPYSTVYRLHVGGEGGVCSTVLYAKVFRSSVKNLHNQQKYLERLRTEFEVAQQLGAAFPDHSQFAFVRPVAYYPELLALVTEEARGRVLAELISEACKPWSLRKTLADAVLHCRRAGHALAALQSVTRSTEPFDGHALLEYVQIRMQRLLESTVVPFSSSDYKRTLDFFENTLRRIPQEQLGQCGCHCDYAPFNLLADDERVTVLDFSMFKVGSRYNDVTYFHHRVEGYLHKPIFRAPAIRLIQHAFLEGFNEGSGGARAPVEKDLLFRVLWMKHVINNYSAIMRNRVGGGRRVSLAVSAFHRRIFKRYNEWLVRMCREPVLDLE